MTKSRLKRAVLFAVGLGLSVAAGFTVLRLRESLTSTVPLVVAIEKMPESPNQFQLRTQSLPGNLRVHLLDGEFSILQRIGDIPDSCGSPFVASFISSSGNRIRLDQMNFAEPGGAFQESDHIRPGLPFRRLQFAGVGTTNCFIHYQSGGKMYPTFCLAVVDRSTHKTIWVGESQKSATSLDELRLLLQRGQFDDAAGPLC